jgi:hypothetical protein
MAIFLLVAFFVGRPLVRTVMIRSVRGTQSPGPTVALAAPAAWSR